MAFVKETLQGRHKRVPFKGCVLIIGFGLEGAGIDLSSIPMTG